ncbi:hypothetical protein EGR_03076 [Echinococcus granulosus]|uniref:Uncharacterized protein n=1 Tax=Echinococcus granulosus TaxID=6210 RepID=W6UKK2_ECHGR|nr:hypothetical protein EGR_03076 [Echinococcus granulosus]EUB62055.1 hypothetical protein EGR_03076 [Echinococcus granulosus]
MSRGVEMCGVCQDGAAIRYNLVVEVKTKKLTSDRLAGVNAGEQTTWKYGLMRCYRNRAKLYSG